MRKPTDIADIVALMESYHRGELDDAQVVDFFQRLIDLGMDRQLGGSYGRNARRLIEMGLCERPMSANVPVTMGGAR